MSERAKAPGAGAPLFRPTQVDEVFGSLAFAGKAKTVEEMDEAVAEQARRAAAEANRSRRAGK